MMRELVNCAGRLRDTGMNLVMRLCPSVSLTAGRTGANGCHDVNDGNGSKGYIGNMGMLLVILLMTAALFFAPGFAGLNAYAAETHTQGSASWSNNDKDNTADLYIKLVDPEGDMITASQIDIMLSTENSSSIESATFDFDPQWNDLKLKSYNFDKKTGIMTIVVATDGKSGIYTSTASQDEVKAGTLKVDSHEAVRAVIVSSKAVSEGVLSDVVSIHGMEITLAANLPPLSNEANDPDTPGNDNNGGYEGSGDNSGNGGNGGNGSGFTGSNGNGSNSGGGYSDGGHYSGVYSGGTGLSAVYGGSRKEGNVSVINGTWTYDPATDKWTLNNRQYKNQWAYVLNQYAAGGQSQNDWFYFDNDGYMLTGWFTDANGVTFYLNESSDGTRGAMKTGWAQIHGKWYYFNTVSDGTKGRLFKSATTPDGYKVDANGIWIQ